MRKENDHMIHDTYRPEADFHQSKTKSEEYKTATKTSRKD